MAGLKESKVLKLIVSILIAEFAGIIGSVFTTPSIPIWYEFLIKPSFNPPSWLFGPVWTTLFLLMGISAYLVWIEGWENKEVKIALSVYGVQLVLNTLWSILFFGLQSPFAGFLGIIPLWIAIVLTILLFYKISKKAAYLLIPYILWVSFAAILNFTIWQLNPWPYGQLIIDILILQGLAAL
ncbi:MAG: TspO/MBR family protein [Candidatus Lokiarchaeia archaeon]